LTEKNLKKNLFTLRLPLEIGVEGRVYFARHLAVSSQIAFEVFFLFAVTARHPPLFSIKSPLIFFFINDRHLSSQIAFEGSMQVDV